ncbi:MAG: hypothetical protein MHMPM18_002748 [Marteilia pararefringens]
MRRFSVTVNSFSDSSSREKSLDATVQLLKELSRIAKSTDPKQSPQTILLLTQTVVLCQRQIKILKIKESKIGNLESLKQRIFNNCYKLFNQRFNPEQLECDMRRLRWMKNTEKIKSNQFKAKKSTKCEDKLDSEVRRRVWLNSSCLNANQDAFYASRWNRFSKKCDASNTVYFGSKEEARAHQLFNSPHELYSKQFINSVEKRLSRASQMIRNK